MGKQTHSVQAIRVQDFFLQNRGRPRELTGLEIPEVVGRVPGIEVSGFHEMLKTLHGFN